MAHHHQRDPIKEKKDKTIRWITIICFALGLVSLIPYLAAEFFPFITAVQAYKKVNVSTICYTMLRLMLVLTPLIIAFPSKPYKNMIEKINLLGKLLALVSFFFFSGMVADILTYNIFGGYVDVGEDPIMIKMLCGYIGVGGVIFCFVQGVFYLLLSKKIRGHKRDVVLLFAGAYVTYMVLPFIFMAIKKKPMFTEEWYTWFGKNVFLWLSNLFMLIGLVVATMSRRVWGKILWQ